MAFALLPIAIAVSLFLATLLFRSFFSRDSKLPPGPRPWPFLGNLPFIVANAASAHRAFARLASQYGALFYLRIGYVPAVVVSSAALAREFLQTHDKNFSDRPHFGLVDALLYGRGNGLAFTNYGPRWRELRKLCTVELFSQQRLQAYEHVRHEEVAALIRFIERESKAGKRYVEVKQCVGMVGMNVIGRLVLSRKMMDWDTGAGNELHSLAFEAFSKLNSVLIGDFFPLLGWLDVPTKRVMRGIHQRFDKYLSGVVEERLSRVKGNGNSSTDDLLDVMLAQTERRDKETLDSLKSLIVELFGAGIDTSSISIEWIMAELIRHPAELEKVQGEINMVLAGETRLVKESDLPHLMYLQAVLKESMRLHPPTPLLIPHASHESCEVGGYKIPAKANLYVNVWAIGRDELLWEKPDEFMPMRFMGSKMDMKGLNHALIPFGSGRRSCPGMLLALQVVPLVVANLLHSFDWRVEGEMDMSEVMTGNAPMVVPLLALPLPKIPSVL